MFDSRRDGEGGGQWQKRVTLTSRPQNLGRPRQLLRITHERRGLRGPVKFREPLPRGRINQVQSNRVNAGFQCYLPARYYPLNVDGKAGAPPCSSPPSCLSLTSNNSGPAWRLTPARFGGLYPSENTKFTHNSERIIASKHVHLRQIDPSSKGLRIWPRLS
jgi:hypothetical protein